MATYGFGSGILWGVQLTDVNGASIANPTPQRLGALQEMSLDIDLPLKELYGTNYFPLAVGRGTAKVSSKCKFAQVNMGVLNSLYFAEPSQPNVGGSSQIIIVNDEGGTIGTLIPATPFQITVVNASNMSSGNPGTDLGVRYTGAAALAAGVAGKYLKQVASGPTAGQYTFVATTGVYTFASADNVSEYAVTIDYGYSVSAGTLLSIQMGNHALGSAPSFKAFGKVKYGSNSLYFQLNNCVSSKLSIPTKLDGFTIAEFDFDSFVDATGNLGILTSGDY
jgi:hypothetical protein